jgi:hypothetical protein
MPDRSNGRGQAKCSPWSFALWVRLGANRPTPEKSTVTKPTEPMGEAKTQSCSASKEEELVTSLDCDFLKTLSVSETIYLRMVGWLVNDELKMIWNEEIVVSVKYCHSI